MDPNAALEQINNNSDEIGLAIEALDEWRSRGGFKPQGSVKRTSIEVDRLTVYERRSLARIADWLDE